MDSRKIVLGVVITGLISGSMLLTPSRSIAGDEIDEDILEAYESDPDVATEIMRFRDRGYEDGGPRGVMIESMCGVAGCGYNVLIVHTFGTTRTNPQTRSMLTLVRVGPREEIASVERMELKPIDPKIRIDKRIPPPSPDVRVKEKIPAPAPELSVEPRRPAP